MTTDIAPIVAYDAHERPWNGDLPNEFLERFRAWMSGQGIDPKPTRAIAVYLVDVPYAVVTEYVRDEHGIILDAVTRDPVTKTRTVLLSSLPPETGDTE